MSEALKEKHRFFVEELDEIVGAQKDERTQAKEDRRFYSIPGAMWEGPLKQQFENKPRFEANKVHKAVIRVVNEYRNNRIDVNFIPKDGVESDLPDACNSVYRADQEDSMADEAIDNAFEEAVGGGMGAFRLCADYENDEDDEDERQHIEWESIVDADQCVYFDLGAKRQDKSDAKRCYVLTGMTRRAFKDEFDKEPVSMDYVEAPNFDWVTSTDVYVCEVYEEEKVTTNVTTLTNPTVEEKKKVSWTEKDEKADHDKEIRELKILGWKVEKSRKLKKCRIHKYIIDGQEVLEDCGYIAGEHIPVVPVYGKRWFVDGIERFMGVVRLAKDSQRLKNMMLSLLAETAAYSAMEKPILTPEQVAGHENLWARDNIDNNPYLLVNAIRDEQTGNPINIGPAAYTKPPTIPPALAALLNITEMDIADILGNPQDGEKIESNLSGKAVELVQTRLDMQSFIYMSNMAKALKRAGQIWLGMAKELYVEKGRKLKAKSVDGALDYIEIARPSMKDGKQITENDFSRADLDVVATVGPSSESKRAAVARNLIQLAAVTPDPMEKSTITGFAIQNIDGEGLNDLREFYRRKNVLNGLVEPTEEDKKRMAEAKQNQEPDANTKYLEAAAAEAASKAREAESRVGLNVAKAVESQINAAQKMAETEQTDIQNASHLGQAMVQPQPVEAVMVSPDVGQQAPESL